MSTAPGSSSRRTPWLVISLCPAVTGIRVFVRTRAICATSSYQWQGSSNQRIASGSTRAANSIASSAVPPRLASTARMKTGPAALRAAATRSAPAPGARPAPLGLQPALPARPVGLHRAADIGGRLARHVVAADRDDRDLVGEAAEQLAHAAAGRLGDDVP